MVVSKGLLVRIWNGPLAVLVLATSCGVNPVGQPTGGITLPRPDASTAVASDAGDAGRAGDAEPHGDAGMLVGPTTRGYVVIDTDYQSTNVSLVSNDDQVASSSFISSSSAKPGLSAPLGGDVVPPTMLVPGNEIVLIDRYPASVLTWVNLDTASVRGQLSVATGFSSNPHDYVTYTANKAFVPRYEPNLASGKQPFDGGNDVLVIDPSVPKITGRIDMTPVLAGEPAGFYPHADRAVIAGGKLRVTADGFNVGYTKHVDARIVTIDPDTNAITQTLVFAGMTSCANIAVSPNGRELALGCNGDYEEDPADGFPDAGIIVVSVGDALTETKRLTSKALGIDQVYTLEWSGPETLVVVTSGILASDRTTVLAPDRVQTVNVRTGVASAAVFETKTTAFSLGDVRCELSNRTCLVTDAETDGGVLEQFTVASDGTVSLARRFKVDPAIGLPPRNLGRY